MGGGGQWRLSRLALQLFALCAFAVAQPLFDLLGRTPEFLLVRRADSLDVLVLAAAIAVLPPLALTALDGVAGLFGRRARVVLHVGLVGLLGALCVLPAVNRNLGGSATATLELAALAGVVLAAGFVWSPGLRAFLGWLAPAGLVFPVLFLLHPSTRLILSPPVPEIGAAGDAHDVPIVMVVFDEFPTFALVGEDGDIDATLFPNFARLARDGTWFRNATTVATVTPAAVAGILTGTAAGPSPLGNAAAKSRNLFTLLGGAYDMDVREAYVPFCPGALCGRRSEAPRSERQRSMLSDAGLVLLHVLAPAPWAARLPDLAYATLLLRRAEPADHPVGAHWSHRPAERAAAIDDFIAAIGPSPKPVLHYLHVLVPHVPYVYEPSGRTCAEWRRAPDAAWWYGKGDPLVLQQRLLMQVAWVDAMVGRLLARLEDTGLYERALLVLVADHGISFRPGDQRRALTETNACDVLGVPLFVKAPHQARGGVSDRNVEVIDILPTIASLVGIAIPWPVDGQPAMADGPERAMKTVVGPSWPTEKVLGWSDGRITFPDRFGVECLTERRPNPEVAWGNDARRIFRVGAYGDLVGHVVSAAEIGDPAGIQVSFTGTDPSAPLPGEPNEVPCVIEGEVTAAHGTAERIDLVVAINGTIEAAGSSRLQGGRATFSIPVPAAAFRPGPNDVRVLVPQRSGAIVRFLPTDDPRLAARSRPALDNVAAPD
jgi:hypothetical protein